LENNFDDSLKAPTEHEPMFNVPLVLVVLIGSFVVVHIARSFVGDLTDYWILMVFAFSPARLVPVESMPGLVFPGGWGADYWTFVSHMFLHADWFHLIINSVWMLAFGSVVARRFGSIRFLGFSMLAAAAGAFANLLLHWGEFSFLIGASGAISGQMAGSIRLMFSTPHGLAHMRSEDFTHINVLPLVTLLTVRPALIFIGLWLGLNFVFGISGFGAGEDVGRIAWEAHLGGFIAGLVLFGLFDRKQR